MSAGEIVLIWTTTVPGRADATIPSAPRMTDSTASSDGRIVQTTSALFATALADAAGSPPSVFSASRRRGHDVVAEHAMPARR